MAGFRNIFKLLKFVSVILLTSLLVTISISVYKKDVGFLIYHNGLDRWNADIKHFRKQAKIQGINFKIISVKRDTVKGDDKRMLKGARRLINRRIKVLVIMPNDQYAASNIVDFAIDNNVKVISYDRLIRNCELDFYISFDSKEIGRLQAEYVLQKKPYGNYVLIGGPVTDNNSFLLREGQMEILNPYIESGKINIVYEVFSESWMPDQGKNHVLQALKKDSISVIISSCDGLSRGVIEALPKNMRKTTLVTGQDTDSKNCQDIWNSSQTMSIYKPVDELASKVVLIASKLVNEEIIQVSETINNGKYEVPSLLLPTIIVDGNNLKKIIKRQN